MHKYELNKLCNMHKNDLNKWFDSQKCHKNNRLCYKCDNCMFLYYDINIS